MAAAFISIRITARLPLEVNGGRTRWRLFLAYGGKNVSRASLIARCVETGEAIAITEGRAGSVEHAVMNLLSAREGTILAKIFQKLVRDGAADYVDTTSDWTTRPRLRSVR